MAKKKTQENFINDICNKHNIQKKDFRISDYAGWDKPIDFFCNRCGSKKTLSNAGELLKKNKNHPHICRCYSYGEDWLLLRKEYLDWKENQENFDIINDKNYSIHPSIVVRCKNCNSIQNRSPKSLIQDGCLSCGAKPHGVIKSIDYANQQLSQNFMDEYEFIGEWKGTHKSSLVRHNDCGYIYTVTSPVELIKGRRGFCPKCSKMSQGERQIFRFLEKNNIDFKYQHRLAQWKRAPYDFFLPRENILIEFQGKQHFQPVSKFGGLKSFEKQKEIDKKKKEIAIKNGYKIIYFEYKELANLLEIMVQRLSQLGVGGLSEKIAISKRDEDIV